MTGVIYARYSEGPRQTDQSIEGQVADCRAFAAKNGIDILDIYADRHISGKSVDRRLEFQRMIRDAQDHKFDVVLVWKVDRFGRDRQDIAINKARLKRAGVKLMYAEESVPEGPEGIILESVLEGIAEYYSADLRQKVLRGRRETLKKGKYCGSVLPIGYAVDADRHIVIDEAKAPAIREVFRMYASGARTKDCIDYLNGRGIVGTNGAKISQAVIYRMLRNDRYLGIFDSSGVELRVDPLIDEATFKAVAERFSPAHNMNATGKASVDFLLSCRCFCRFCSTMLVGESGRGKAGRVYFYYKCGNKKRGGRCDLKPIRKEKVEQIIVDATLEDMLDDSTIVALADEILRVQEIDLADDPAVALKSKLDSCRKRQRNIIAAIEEAGTRGLAQRLAALEEEERELEIEIQKAEIKRPRLSRREIEGWLRSFKNGDKDDEDFRKRLLETFVARVELDNDVAVIFYNVSDKQKQKRTISLCSDILDKLGKEKGILGEIFMQATNKISNAAILYRVVQMIDKEKWVSMSSDVKGEIYEGLLQKNAEDTKSGAGQYFTPRPLIRAMVRCLQPRPGETVADPCCGSGGFFLATQEFLTDPANYPSMTREQKQFIKNDTFYGTELVPVTYKLCLMNLYLHNIGDLYGRMPVTRGDALLSDPSYRVDYVMTNPPFGKKSSLTFTNEEGEEQEEDLVYNRQDFWTTGSNKQLNFLQHINTLLKTDGKAAVVLPDNVLFEGGAGETVRKKLLETCELHTILRLPTGIFYKPGVKANVLFFDRKPASPEMQTKEIWVYDFRTNIHFTLKQNPMRDADLEDFVRCYHPENRHERQETWSEDNPDGRWRRFPVDFFLKRDKTSFDHFWIKDKALADLDNLPAPDILAADIIENLQSALQSFSELQAQLKKQ